MQEVTIETEYGCIDIWDEEGVPELQISISDTSFATAQLTIDKTKVRQLRDELHQWLKNQGDL